MRSVSETDKKRSGIYAIHNIETGRLYVGSTNNLWRRRMEHFRSLEIGTHCNRWLQASFNKRGRGAFEYIILVDCDEGCLIATEQNICEYFRQENQPLYNTGEFVDIPLRGVFGAAHPSFGKKLTDDHKQKCACPGERNGMFGRHHTEEVRRFISQLNKGRKLSQEQKNHISRVHTGVPKSQIHREKIRDANLSTFALNPRPTGKESKSTKYIWQQRDDSGIVVAEFVGEAELMAAGFTTSGVCSVLSKKQKSHRGYKWTKKDIER